MSDQKDSSKPPRHRGVGMATGIALGAAAWDVRRLVLGGARGALTIPATTASETAVRAVLDAGGPVDTPTVVALLQAIAPRHGVTPAASVRRDLTVLEQRTAGVPRVRVLHHDRRAYFYPAHLNRADVMKEVAGW